MAAPEWSWSENERFESALAAYGTDEPGCWDRVAAAVGGGRTAEDVRHHFDQLVHDVRRIEAGGRSSSNRGGTAGTSNDSSRRDNRRPQT